jgi:two-component system cell cycle response regulator DivK
MVSRKRKAFGILPGAPAPGRAPVRCALVVDDEDDSRALYGEVLRLAGYVVIEATNGLDALERAIAERPDIVVMDLCMPRMDGWEAARKLKTDLRTRDVPLITLTAIGWHPRSIEVHCDAYLLKPCMPVDLLAVVDALLARVPGASEARIRVAPPAVARDEDDEKDWRRR